MTEGKDVLHQTFDKATPEKFGSAEMTTPELSALRKFYLATREKLFGRVKEPSPEDKELKLSPEDKELKLSPKDRELIREFITESIIKDGWPKPQEVSIENLGETAIAHACVVAENLLEERGVEATPDTYFSYTTKNQFDRFTSTILRKKGRIKKGGDLYDQWFEPQDRESGFKSDKVRFPTQVDSTKIHGVAKPNRYWPAQLMKQLEAIRLNKISPQEKEKLLIGKSFPEKYAIPWVSFKSAVEQAGSIDDIAVGIAVRTMEILHRRGLSNEQIIQIILAGYNPSSFVSEHGKIPEVGKIWHSIIKNVATTDELQGISALLNKTITERMTSIGYPFVNS